MSGMRMPVWTLTIATAAAIVFGVPALEALLVYNREAIANGEVWRLVTGNAVHLSPNHFVRDLVAFALAGIALEATLQRHFAVLCLISASVIGVVLYLTYPDVLVYGGLSGVVTAILVYLALFGVSRRPAYRWLYITILAAVAAKIGAEMLFIETRYGSSQAFVPLHEVHALGAATALLLFALTSAASATQFVRTRANSAAEGGR